MIETVIWHSLLPQTVGENIRKFRKELKLSQSDLAKKCNLSSYMISKMERGKHDFRITEIEKISFGLNKKINEIIWKKLLDLNSEIFAIKKQVIEVEGAYFEYSLSGSSKALAE